MPSIGPPKAYFFAAPYTLTFSDTFKITNDQLLLANKNIEAQNQQAFINKFNDANDEYFAEQEPLITSAHAKREDYQKSQQNSL